MDIDAPTTSTSRAPAPGQLALVQELVNTLDIELGQDELIDRASLEEWLRARGLLAAGEPLDGEDLERARGFREALRTLLYEHASEGERTAAAAALDGVAPAALLRVRFAADGVPELAPAAGGLDGALAGLLAIIDRAACDGTWQRLKVCAEHSCRYAFYDHSRNRSGSWCTMAVCGNRAKARSYRERRRNTPRH
jgi:predicted RNA-binding Zn ribbon-like protein